MLNSDWASVRKQHLVVIVPKYSHQLSTPKWPYMPLFQIEHLDLFLTKSYLDFSLNGRKEHRNFDISFKGFKILTQTKITSVSRSSLVWVAVPVRDLVKKSNLND